MVRHDAAHDLAALPTAPGREVHRLPQPEAPAAVDFGEADEVAHRGVRRDGQGEVRRVWRADRVRAHAPLQRQRGAAVRLVPVGERRVQREERALALPPRRALGHVPPLHVEAKARALPQQGTALQRQKQLGHQVLEHRARPARQTAIAVAADQRAAELPPVPGAYRAAGHGVVAGQARLAGHEVVAALAQRVLRGVVAYAEQAAPPVVERGEVHALRQRRGAPGQLVAAVLAQPRGERGEARGQVAAVHRRHVGRRERLERARVVPVVEVAAPLVQPLAGVEHPADYLRGAIQRREPQVERGERADHAQADIGRRGALGHAHRRLLLPVVRREVAAAGGAELVKIRPYLRALVHEEAALPGGRHGLAAALAPQGEREYGRGQPDYPQRLARRVGREYQQRKPQRNARPGRADGRKRAAGAGLSRGLPLQKPPAGYEHPPERRARRGQVHPGLPGQEQQPEHHLTHAESRAVERPSRVPLPPRAPRERARDRPRQAGAERERRHCPRRVKPRQQRRERYRRRRGHGDEAPAHAVEQLEPVGGRKAAPQPQQHGEVLPVAPYPAVLALEVRRGRGGEAVRQYGVAHVSAMQQRALHGVVREDEVLRQVGAARQQGVHVEYALPGEAAAAGEIHPHLAAGRAVGVDAAGTCHGAGEVRGLARGQLHAYARMYHPAPGDDGAVFAQLRAVERVQHGADELARRAGQDARIRIQSYNVARPGEGGGVAGEDFKLALPPGAQPCEGEQRAALALVRAPDPVAPGLPPLARKEVKAARILPVQAVYRPSGRFDRRGVGGGLAAFRLRQIRQQTEAQLPAAVARGQAELLQPARERLAVFRLGEYGRHHTDAAPLARHAVSQLHARHAAHGQRAKQRRVQRVFHKLARRQQREQRRPRPARYRSGRQRDADGERAHGQGVEPALVSLRRPAQRLAEQPPAHVAALGLVPVLLGQSQHSACALALADVLPRGQARQTPPVTGASALVHARVGSGRVARQYGSGGVGALHQGGHVRRGQRAQALDRRRHPAHVRRAGGEL